MAYRDSCVSASALSDMKNKCYSNINWRFRESHLYSPATIKLYRILKYQKQNSNKNIDALFFHFKGTGNVECNVRDFSSLILFTIMSHEDNDLIIVWSSNNQATLSLQGI